MITREVSRLLCLFQAVLLGGLASSALANGPAWTTAPGSPRKVILLTSVDGLESARALPASFFWLRNQFYALDSRLEADFRRHFEESGYEAEVFHYADMSLLYRVLHSPDYAAVYWVSHGANARNDSNVSTGGIYDYQTFDLSPLFKEVHPNIRLLSIVSCHSSKEIRQLRDEGEFAQGDTGLTVLSYSDQIDARAGLLGVLAQGDPILDKKPKEESASSCAQARPGLFVSLRRVCRQAGPALFAQSNDRLIAILPRCREGGEIQVESGYIDLSGIDSELDPSQLDVTVSSGSQPVDRVITNPEPHFGDISIRHSASEQSSLKWSLLEMHGFSSLGVDRRIYAYQGPLPPLENRTAFHPFHCKVP